MARYKTIQCQRTQMAQSEPQTKHHAAGRKIKRHGTVMRNRGVTRRHSAYSGAEIRGARKPVATRRPTTSEPAWVEVHIRIVANRADREQKWLANGDPSGAARRPWGAVCRWTLHQFLVAEIRRFSGRSRVRNSDRAMYVCAE